MVELTSVPAFTLNEKEKKLFDTLTGILKENNLKTVLRVCGGWVRDKVSLIHRDLILFIVDFGNR
jgi:hypothetical protein